MERGLVRSSIVEAMDSGAALYCWQTTCNSVDISVSRRDRCLRLFVSNFFLQNVTNDQLRHRTANDGRNDVTAAGLYLFGLEKSLLLIL